MPPTITTPITVRSGTELANVPVRATGSEIILAGSGYESLALSNQGHSLDTEKGCITRGRWCSRPSRTREVFFRSCLGL